MRVIPRPVRSVIAGSELGLRLCIVVFLLAPVVTIAVLSFANERNLVFPPHRWGGELYSTLFHSSSWLDAIRTSFLIGIPSALLAVLVGTPAAYGFSRVRFPGRAVVRAVGLSPIVIPGVAYAIAIYAFYAKLHLLQTTIGVIIAHATLGVPFVLLVVGTALDRISPEYELVAMTLGASRRRGMFDTTLRLVLPAIGAAFIFAFLASFDEAVLVQFIAGPSQNTLPKAIYDSLRTGFTPVILPIATLLILLTGVLVFLGTYWRSRNDHS